jgi:hypothetical protein
MHYFSITATATQHLIFGMSSYRALDIDVDTHSKRKIKIKKMCVCVYIYITLVNSNQYCYHVCTCFTEVTPRLVIQFQ